MSTQAINKADKALEASYQTVRQWEYKAREARSQAAQLEADSGREILAGGSAHDIAVKINAADLEAKAFDNAAAQARAQLAEARTGLLEAHAADQDAQAAKAAKKRDEMDEQEAALLAQLEELTGHEYRIHETPLQVGESRLVPQYQLAHRAPVEHATNAAWVRYYLAHGRHPWDFYALQEFGGSGIRIGGAGLCDPASGPQVFKRLKELEVQANLEPSAADDAAEELEPVGSQTHAEERSTFDPVEDADIIARMGLTK